MTSRIRTKRRLAAALVAVVGGCGLGLSACAPQEATNLAGANAAASMEMARRAQLGEVGVEVLEAFVVEHALTDVALYRALSGDGEAFAEQVEGIEGGG